MKAVINSIRKNRMGTISFNMLIKGMRKEQDFIVYPMASKTVEIMIQSGKRFGFLNAETGKGTLTANRANGAYSIDYSIDRMNNKLVEFEVSDLDLQALKMQVFVSASSKAGDNGVIYTDNSGAKEII